ncbi:hypothetical protein ANO11243_041520 [Dothideomycetidae sp. 11243]|nr:hypothetical protein ANO11243_041520 [fungal sp. No.11243]
MTVVNFSRYRPQAIRLSLKACKSLSAHVAVANLGRCPPFYASFHTTIHPALHKLKTMPDPESSFTSILKKLTAHPAPLLPPPNALYTSMTASIASLQLHPTLEALLHLYNHDLPSAHFLVRHMQAAPAYEGMYIHGLLHRIEGDYSNCLAWYADVASSEVFQSFYGRSEDETTHSPAEEHLSFLPSSERQSLSSPAKVEDEKLPPQSAARIFIRAIKALHSAPNKNDDYKSREASLEKVSAAEMQALTKWCVDRFGTEKLEDASGAWAVSDEHTREIGQKMVSGGEGYRKF